MAEKKMKSETPFSGLPDRAFWRPSVAQRSLFDLSELWRPKFKLEPHDACVAFGSCFAQHFGRSLTERGFNWLQTEMPPPGMSEKSAFLFGYKRFSCRTGNIYTASLLRQWLSWATGEHEPAEEAWETENGIFDPFRPNIEPYGFSSLSELKHSRRVAIEALHKAVQQAKLFVFTLGLTESWQNVEHGYEYSVCPGVIAGRFEPDTHLFVNQKFEAIRASLFDAIRMIRQLNPCVQILLTVSPVPLTATKSDMHVLVATSHSKSILRAVAGQLAQEVPYVDYFPSYEIITSPAMQGVFFEPNKRSVTRQGVSFVMDHFFSALGEQANDPNKERLGSTHSGGDVICEEEMLDAFRRPAI